jgi:hypothetical protein
MLRRLPDCSNLRLCALYQVSPARRGWKGLSSKLTRFIDAGTIAAYSRIQYRMTRTLIRSSAPMAPFRLSKWYLDCVTDLGDASIAYTGTAHWGMVRLHYSSLLESTGGRITARHSLREQDEPEIKETSICWRTKALDMEGEWRASSFSLRETIYSSEEGRIEWHCLMPQAETRFRDRSGLGYAEHLTMTIPPWKLPIKTLLWGRFTSDSDSVVWIDWQGEFVRRIIYTNGKAVSVSKLEDHRIEFDDGSLLTMDCSLVMREGPLGTTALSAIPGIRRTFPARLLQVNECKWRSRARWQAAGRRAVEGWAIHERVNWPK